MNIFFAVSGFIFVAILSIAALLASGAWFLEARSKRHDRLRAALYDKAVRDIGSTIHSQSYWFSEDPSAYALARIMGQRMMEWPAYDVSGIRDDWRKQAEVERRAMEERSARIRREAGTAPMEGGAG